MPKATTRTRVVTTRRATELERPFGYGELGARGRGRGVVRRARSCAGDRWRWWSRTAAGSAASRSQPLRCTRRPAGSVVRRTDPGAEIRSPSGPELVLFGADRGLLGDAPVPWLGLRW